MEIDEFISETLRQILAGVAKAQETEIGQNVNAAFPGVLGSNLSVLPEFGVFARVDFDVAVTAETSKEGKGSIRVWGIGAEAGKESRSQTVSRVVFAVPLRLPDGDQTQRIKADAAQQRRIEELRRAEENHRLEELSRIRV
ncbi:trypco2 family protein [Bradyrhizobium sp. Arg314]